MESRGSVFHSLTLIEQALASSGNATPSLAKELAYIRAALARAYMPRGESFGISDVDLAMEEVLRTPRLAPPSRKPPVFIISHRRSGTTLLSWLLNAHPSFAFVPENSLCVMLLSPKHRTDYLPFPMLSALLSLEKIGESRSVHLARYASLIDGVFGDYATRQGKARWVTKELHLDDCLDLLDAMFDYRARYIYLARHGLDVAFSAHVSDRFGYVMRLSESSSLGIERNLLSWVRLNEAASGFWACNRDRCLLLRYEDLVVSPEEEAKRIFEFLDEPWIPTIVEDMQNSRNPISGDLKIHRTSGKVHANSRGRWTGWPQGLLWRLGRLANPMLTQLGYEPVADVSEPIAPPPAPAPQ